MGGWGTRPECLGEAALAPVLVQGGLASTILLHGFSIAPSRFCLVGWEGPEGSIPW